MYCIYIKKCTPEILNTIKHLLQIFGLVYNICEFTTQNQKVFATKN